jgi:uncharacterized protein
MAIFLKAKWENIIMANYAMEPAILIPYLPKGVELDLYNGKAYVSLVGFMFKETKLFNIPIPRLGTFEEINLRFYVVRKEMNEIKRGVVFVNETIPYKAVAWMANKLYKEHYTAIPTRHLWKIENEIKTIKYEWKIDNEWNNIEVQALTKSDTMTNDSFEAFIFEHYYGYTKINDNATEEYKIKHPSWKINKVMNIKIDCNFNKMYGEAFEYLGKVEPESVFIAEGSAIEVEWKRNRLLL